MSADNVIRAMRVLTSRPATVGGTGRPDRVGDRVHRGHPIVVDGHNHLDVCTAELVQADLLDVAHVEVDATEQARIAAAVQSGTGLVSFDSEAASPAYDFVQTVFGFGSSTSRAVSSIEITSSVPASGSW